MKHIIFILSLLFILSSFNVCAEDFPTLWAKNDVEQAILDGYVPQNLQNDYQSVISREKFCELAVSMLEVKDKQWVNPNLLQNPYCDTENTAVLILDRMNIVNGKDTEALSGKKIFEPNSSITREEAAKILNLLMEKIYDSFVGLNAFNIDEVSNAISGYADNLKISDWAKDYVGKITVRGMMNGVENNNFEPQGIYTVEQAIVTISRIYNYSYNAPWEITINNIPIEHTKYESSDVKSFTADIKKDNAGNFIAAGNNVEHLSEIGIINDPYYGGVQFWFCISSTHYSCDDKLFQLCREMCTYNYMFEHIKDNTEYASQHMKIYINGELQKFKEVRERHGNGHRDFFFIFDDNINPNDISTISVVCE